MDTEFVIERLNKRHRRAPDPLASRIGVAQPAESLPVGKGLIDIHYHLAEGGSAVQARERRTRVTTWTPARAIEEMDSHGVAVGIISTGSSAGRVRTVTEQVRWARERNERAARFGEDYPKRFGSFATLPLPDIDNSLEEVEYALNVLKADGIGLVTNYGDLWLGDPEFRPLFQELDRFKAVVFVHPTDAPCCTADTMTYMRPPVTAVWLEWPMNTARAIFSLMINGVIRDFPEIRFIFSHGGGAMPPLLARISGFAEESEIGPEKLHELLPNGAESEFCRCYFDIAASSVARPNMEALLRLVPTSHILFGSDYPHFSIAHSSKGLADLDLPPNLRRSIERDNALSLLPRWQD